jgi:hypothetical protein
MGYYGSEPSPVSVEPASEDANDAIETTETLDGAEGMETGLGDGLLVRNPFHGA